MKFDIRKISIILSFSILATVLSASSVLSVGVDSNIDAIYLDTLNSTGNVIDSFTVYDMDASQPLTPPTVSLDTSELYFSTFLNVDDEDATSTTEASDNTRVRFYTEWYDASDSLIDSYETIESTPASNCSSISTGYQCEYETGVDLGVVLGFDSTVSEGQRIFTVIEYQLLT